ncbi:MAG TPA: hypothetical protein VFB96_11270, partial [Pirellulaceae bacterium]|nr:hypothetical protein [Pirellulaceae bacterium]
MSIDSLAQRPRYQRSGKVRWGRLLWLMPIPLMVALTMAAALFWTLAAGFYYVFITPLILSLPLLAAAHLTVRWAHCRSGAVAALLGGLLGIVMYVAYFHVHLVWVNGPATIHRLDALPNFIAWRMQNDVQMDADLPQPQQPDVTGNWLRFSTELAAIAAAVAGISFTAAGGAYCEACGQWMRMSLESAPAGTARKIAEHLATGRLAELTTISKGGAIVGNSSMIKVESCRRAGQAETCHAYLTLQETDPGGIFSRVKTVQLLSGGQITQEELGWLTRSIPALAPLSPPGFAAAAAAKSAAAQSPQGKLPVRGAGVSEAVIETLPSGAAEIIYTKTTILIASCLSLIPVGVFLAGIGLLVAAWWFRPANLADTTRVGIALACLVTGGAATLFGVLVCYVNLDYPGMQYVLSLTRNAIALRPDAIVNPSDPRAIWVEIVPRQRWTDVAIDKSSDGGLLLVDEENRRVLFEGIKQRYRIPAGAIAHCEA